MKKLMVVSQLLVVMVLAATSCIFAADVCIHVPDDLALNMCVQYQNNYYTGTFRYSPVQNLPDGTFYWKLDAGTFKSAIDTGDCFPVSNTLDMNICGEYHATEYQFAFRYAPTGTDTESSLNWKIDSGTFKQRSDANQDTVYSYAKDITRSYQEGNPNLAIGRTSKAYLDNGSDYSCMSEVCNYDLNTYVFSPYSYVINSVSYENQNGKQIAKINYTSGGTWVVKSDSTLIIRDSTSDDTMLIFEDGKWKNYGNQKLYPGPSASSIVACESIDDTILPSTPVGAKTVFTSADNAVYIFARLVEAYNGSVTYSRWYKPGGNLSQELKSLFDVGSAPKCATYKGQLTHSLFAFGYFFSRANGR